MEGGGDDDDVDDETETQAEALLYGLLRCLLTFSRFVTGEKDVPKQPMDANVKFNTDGLIV